VSTPDLSHLADELRQFSLSKHATEHERALLAAASDPETLIVRMGFGEDLVMRPAGAESVAPDEIGKPSDECAQKILRRIELRAELHLPKRKCGARRQREGCDCLEITIDLFAEGEPHEGRDRLSGSELALGTSRRAQAPGTRATGSACREREAGEAHPGIPARGFRGRARSARQAEDSP
jgi:hypothetical protein